MFHIATGQHTFCDPVFNRIDNGIYRICGINQNEGMGWKKYALALVLTNAVMVFIGYLILRIQFLPVFNPNGIGAMEPTLSFNTIISFMTNTNLQHYSGESLPDAGHHLHDVRLRLHRLRRLRGFLPRPDGHQQEQPGQLLCGSGAHHHPHPDPLLHYRDTDPGVAGRSPEFHGQPDGDHHRGHPAGHRHGPHRLPGLHQAPGHQRRRLPGRQLHHPAGEPHHHLRHYRAAEHDDPARRLRDHVRPDVPQPQEAD